VLVLAILAVIVLLGIVFLSMSSLTCVGTRARDTEKNLSWLRDQVLEAIRRGDTRSAIHQANLIPPGLLNGRPDALLPYLILREHVIDRLYQQNTGYWQADLEGLDHLGDSDRAELLVDYLGQSEEQLVTAAEKNGGRRQIRTCRFFARSICGQVRLPQTDGKISEHRRVQIHSLLGQNWRADPGHGCKQMINPRSIYLSGRPSFSVFGSNSTAFLDTISHSM